jgi:gliding motility-associated lipoprotein GldH
MPDNYFYKKLRLRKFYTCLVIPIILCSCNLSSGVFEKNFAIPGQAWESSVKPEISVTIKDTASLYNIFFVIRHSDAYNYNNIWIRATIDRQEESTMKSRQYDLSLATNDKGWLGSAMDDIYEARLLIQPRIRFKQPGDYHITLEQIMREDPLKHILDVGIRLEKVSPGEQ